jgi:NADH:ubiquinone oxidoreductase subunit C
MNLVFKRDMHLWNSTLLDQSAVDCSHFKQENTKLNYFFKNNNLVLFYVYYFYFLKIKINLSLFYNAYKKPHVMTIEKLYKNANWIERETSEMYGVNFKHKKDVRKLLTDYTNFENPLLKSYPTEGFFDVFYNFFDDQVILTNNSVVEL